MDNKGNSKHADRNLTVAELTSALISLAVLLIPIILLVLAPDNRVVAFLFGGGRIFAVWISVYALIFIYRKTFDRFLNKLNK